MSKVLEFKLPVAHEYWEWECGGCGADKFKIWSDGQVVCAECDSGVIGMTAAVVLP